MTISLTRNNLTGSFISTKYKGRESGAHKTQQERNEKQSIKR
jgi:hypothetical protein